MEILRGLWFLFTNHNDLQVRKNRIKKKSTVFDGNPLGKGESEFLQMEFMFKQSIYLPICDKILVLPSPLPWCVLIEPQSSRSIFQIWVAVADNAVSWWKVSG